MTADDWDAVLNDLRRPGGWQKGTSRCLRYAMFRVGQRRRVPTSPGAIALGRVIKRRFPQRVQNLSPATAELIPAFNDHPLTTRAEVLAVCKEARAAS